MDTKINAGNFEWREIEGLLKMLSAISGKQLVGDVSVTNIGGAKDDNGFLMFGKYGTTVDYVKEGVMYSDGTCFVCASVRTFAGTFASQDNISVKYYILTPIAKKTAARMDREIKKGK